MIIRFGPWWVDFTLGNLQLKGTITANGLNPVEFGREIIKRLGLLNEAQTQAWFQMWKQGVYADLEAIE